MATSEKRFNQLVISAKENYQPDNRPLAVISSEARKDLKKYAGRIGSIKHAAITRKTSKNKRPRRSKRPKSINPRYEDYLKSEHWMMTRAAKLAAAKYRCEHCGKYAYQVHHQHYLTLGNERNDDLLALCRPCHRKIHGITGNN